MKNRRYLFLIFSQASVLFADSNVTQEQENVSLTLDHLDKLSGILEPSAGILATQIESFGTNLTIFMSVFIAVVSIFGYLGILKPILDRNKAMEEKIEKQFQNIGEIVNKEVTIQMIYTIDDVLKDAQQYARKRILYEVEKVREEVPEMFSSYVSQELEYEINQILFEESKKIFEQDGVDMEEKMHKIISLQYQYNEITNHYVPKLFRNNMKEIILAAKALSEYKQIKHIIQLQLLDLLHKNIWSNADKAELEKVIDKYYGKKG